MIKALKFFIILVIIPAFSMVSCNNANTEESAGQVETPVAELPEGHYGQMMDEENTLAASSLPELMQEEESMQLKLEGDIAASCKHSGCWMDIDLGNGNVMNVTFADGAFTIPLDAEGKKAIFEGTAYKELVPVDILKARAKDEGAPEEDIEMITEPVWEYTFVANAVIIHE